jgi:hypothetical protein
VNAILGCIESVDCRALEDGAYRADIRLKPRCVMPERKQIPEWLKGQVITVTRVVPDPREVGAPGDSIVLTPSESSKYLLPLVVTPPLLRGSLRGQIHVALRWWKDKKPPELEVRSNGRVRRIRLARKGAYDPSGVPAKTSAFGITHSGCRSCSPGRGAKGPGAH